MSDQVSIPLDDYYDMRQRSFCRNAGIEYIPLLRPRMGVGDIALAALLLCLLLLAFL